MSDSKTYVFQPESGNNALSMLAPMLANRGMDTAAISAMMNNGGFGGNNLWLIFLFFIMGWGSNGWGGNGWGGNRGGTEFLSAQMNNDTGRQLLQQAIAGNTDAISQLSQNLNVDISAVRTALCNLGSSIQQVGAQMGMSTQQVINAIQSGNCDLKNSITSQGYENRLANMEQTAILGSKIDAQTNMINEHFCELKERELLSKIDALRDENTTLKNSISNLNQNSVTAQIVSQATAPITAVLGHVQGEVEDIKRGMPTTVTIPVPLAYQYGIAPYAVGGSLWS